MDPAKARADRLWSKIVRARGRCAACASGRDLEAAHIVPRRFARTRTKILNGLCLCHLCHRRFTEHPDEFETWVRGYLGDGAYEALWHFAREVEKVDWQAEADHLADVLHEVERVVGVRR